MNNWKNWQKTKPGCALVFSSYCHKAPHVGWLETAETSCLTVLDASNRKSRNRHAHSPCNPKGGPLVPLPDSGGFPAIFGIPWLAIM